MSAPSPRSIADIDLQVAKILRGLGTPEPPLDLASVRALLSLDRGFYSSSDQSSIRESASRLIVAGKQVLKRPGILAEAIRKLDLRALYLPDRRRILIDADQPTLKHRWNEAHEIGHAIIPWHQGLMGDDDLTLVPSCHQIVESEANLAAGRLLFLRDRFVNEARQLTGGIGSVRALAKRYGNTTTSTLWRYVEQVCADRPAFALISAHPHPARRRDDFNHLRPYKHFVVSEVFRKCFSATSPVHLFGHIAKYCGPQTGGLLGAQEVALRDDNGAEHCFDCETFFNRYDALTLGLHRKPSATTVFVG